jgi:glutamate racemase
MIDTCARVALIDSGAGGLSILQAMLELEINAEYFYLADLEHFPYGDLDEEILYQRLVTLVSHLIDNYSPDIITIACNTASTSCLDKLRQKFQCSFIGVVPAIKPAAQQTQTQTFGLVATPATITRSYTLDLIQEFAGNSEVILHASSALVAIAEEKIQGTQKNHAADKYELFGLINNMVRIDEKQDVLVLACTHFPLLKNEIHSALTSMGREDIKIVDSGLAIARRARSLIETQGLPCGDKPSLRFVGKDQALDSYASFLKRSFPELDIEIT